ncbi:hypothetical protein [Gemmatimonas sp.]|uniref:hypothetical protein n=1 Tax=Gemmatimonas sp. TaxID=1962908 RepID=UPI003982DFE5
MHARELLSGALLAIGAAGVGCYEPPEGETSTDSGATGSDSATADDSAGGTDTTIGSDTASPTDSGTGADTAVSDTPSTGGKWIAVPTATNLVVGTDAPRNPVYASLSTKVVCFNADSSTTSLQTWEFDGKTWKKILASFPYATASLNSSGGTITGWKDKAYIFGAKNDPGAVYAYDGSAWTVAKPTGGRSWHKAVAWSKGIFLSGNPMGATPATFVPTTNAFTSEKDLVAEMGLLLSTGTSATEVFATTGPRYDGSWSTWTPPAWGEASSAVGNGTEIFVISNSSKTWIRSAAGTWRDAGSAACAGGVLGAKGATVFLFCDTGTFHSVFQWEP